MPKYIFAYHGGGAPADPADQEKAMTAWSAWFQEMGASVVDGGNPVGASKTVTRDSVAGDGGANPISGYSVVEASDHSAACELAKGCPIVADGSGSVEVAEIMEM